MLKRSAAAVLLFVFIMLSLYGCSGSQLKSVENLMHPPLVAGVDRELKKAFEAAVNGKNKNFAASNIILVPPTSGDYRSAFVLHDIDGDGMNEALVFYTLSDDQSKGHMNVLDSSGGSWVSVADFSFSGSSINFVKFVQMSSDSIPAILVSQSIYESDSSKFLSVYVCDPSSNKTSIKNVFTEVYSAMENIDVDGDGQLDIFLIQQDVTNNISPQSTAKVLTMGFNNTISELGSAKLDGGVSGYVSIQSEKVSSFSRMRIYVDALKGENQMITEVIYWNPASRSLRTPLFDVDTQSNIITRREELLKCQDFDSDGALEIPSQYTLEEGRRYVSPKNLYQPMYVTRWIKIDENDELQYTDTLVNTDSSYIVYIDSIEAMFGNVTVYAYDSSNTWIFRKYNAASKTVGDEIFSVIRVTKEQAQEDNIDESMYLLENNDMVVYCKFSDDIIDTEIKAEYIKNCIKIFKG